MILELWWSGDWCLSTPVNAVPASPTWRHRTGQIHWQRSRRSGPRANIPLTTGGPYLCHPRRPAQVNGYAVGRFICHRTHLSESPPGRPCDGADQRRWLIGDLRRCPTSRSDGSDRWDATPPPDCPTYLNQTALTWLFAIRVIQVRWDRTTPDGRDPPTGGQPSDSAESPSGSRWLQPATVSEGRLVRGDRRQGGVPAEGKPTCFGYVADLRHQTQQTAVVRGSTRPRHARQPAGHVPHRRRRGHPRPAPLPQPAVRTPARLVPHHHADHRDGQHGQSPYAHPPPDNDTGDDTPRPDPAAEVSEQLERLKWFLWHGNVFRALQTITDIIRRRAARPTSRRIHPVGQDRMYPAQARRTGAAAADIRKDRRVPDQQHCGRPAAGRLGVAHPPRRAAPPGAALATRSARCRSRLAARRRSGSNAAWRDSVGLHRIRPTATCLHTGSSTG